MADCLSNGNSCQCHINWFRTFEQLSRFKGTATLIIKVKRNIGGLDWPTFKAEILVLFFTSMVLCHFSYCVVYTTFEKAGCYDIAIPFYRHSEIVNRSLSTLLSCVMDMLLPVSVAVYGLVPSPVFIVLYRFIITLATDVFLKQLASYTDERQLIMWRRR